MRTLLIYAILFSSFGLAACGQQKLASEPSPKIDISAVPSPTDDQTKFLADRQSEISPSDSYRRYYEAYAKGDIAKIKEFSSKKTFALFEKLTKEQGSSVEEAVRHQNSLIPASKRGLAIRNEKIDGNRATIEISNPNNDVWLPVLLVMEDGIWKIGDAERIEEIEKGINERAEKLKNPE